MTQGGTIFLDTELKIKRFTPAMKKIFSLRDSDVGRPLSDLASRLQAQDMPAVARTVLEELERREMEVHTEEGQWFLVDARPYRTSQNMIDGVVITFTDISTQKRAEQGEHAARNYAESILETVREPFVVLDGELKVISANRSFFIHFQTTERETEGRLVYLLGNGQWDVPALRSALEEVIPQNNVFEGFQVKHEFPRIGRRVMLLNGRRIRREGQSDRILVAFEDVTDRRPA